MNNYCLICMKKFAHHGLYSFVFNVKICNDCFLKMERKVLKRKINGISITSFYPYNSFMSSLIYSFKGCYDIMLSECFLTYEIKILRLLYKGYYIIPVPSSKESDDLRGFNHVEEIFKPLKLPFLKILIKTKNYKQSSLNAIQRTQSVSYIERISNELLTDKNILLVDDIITTGSTIKRSIELIQELKPKKLKVVTIAYKVGDLCRNNGNEKTKKHKNYKL